MHKIIALTLLFCVSSLAASAAVEQRDLIPGQDFEVLPGKLSTRPQVVEYFNYACSACFSMEPFVMRMKREKPYLVIAVMPLENHPSWRIYVEAFFLGQALGVLNRSHHQLYNRVQVERKPFRTAAEMKTFFLGFGVTEADYDAAKNSTVLANKVSLAKQMAIKNKIGETPSFVVNNIYKLNVNSLGTYEMLEKAFDVLSDLNYKLPVVNTEKAKFNEV